MEIKNLQKILADHALWLKGEGGSRANLQDADLRWANLRRANLRWANLQGANLRWANLQYANLQDANLQYANLQDANLQDANLQDANLQGANLRWANLQYANLQDANLQDADLRGANLRYLVRGNNREIITVQSGKWLITISATSMAIGCEQHNIIDWMQYSDDEISAMDSHALNFWKTWRPILQKIIHAQGWPS